MFYYTLGNIRPVFRSCLQAIQLISVAKSSDIRLCRFDALIQPFIEQVNVLGKVKTVWCLIYMYMYMHVCQHVILLHVYRMKVTAYS